MHCGTSRPWIGRLAKGFETCHRISGMHTLNQLATDGWIAAPDSVGTQRSFWVLASLRLEGVADLGSRKLPS